MAKGWLKGVVAGMKKGALTKQAKAKGQSVAEFSKSTTGKSATTKKRIVLAKLFRKWAKRKGK